MPSKMGNGLQANLLQIWMEVAEISNMVRVLLGTTWERGREGG